MPDYPPLDVVREDDSHVYFLQAEFEDADCYRIGWDGCFLVGEIESRDKQASDTLSWSTEHFCDLDRMIAHLQQIRDYGRKKWGGNGIWDGPDDTPG